MNPYKNSVGVACVLLHSNLGGVYLSERLGSYETHKFACPGGMYEYDDLNFVVAIQRELREETGLNIDHTRICDVFYTSEHIGGKSDMTFWFYVKLTENEIPLNLEPHKHGNWKFYTFEDALKLPLMVSTEDVLRKLLNGSTYES